MKKPIKIQGAGVGGKGGGSTRVAQEAPDTLRSKQFGRILDLISEGEIEGLSNGLKGVYFDETPIENEDGSLNFKEFAAAAVPGSQAQEHLPGFTEIESEKAISVEVKNSQSVTRRISNATLDAIRVTLGVPRLTNQNIENGDLNGSSVQIAIDLQSDGGGFIQVLTNTISGKTTTKYQRAYRIPLTGTAPWDIRVRRLTADSEKSNIQNNIFWDSFTEIIDTKFNYPNSAVAGIQMDAEQFSAIPRRAYKVKGIRVRIPSNYDPITRVYTGVWDGTFKIAWTDNPAWCFYDLAIEPRYGLGDFLSDDQVDKWELFTIGQYCDQLVNDGFGGSEPRFTCNLYLQTKAEAYTVLMNMASIFRGILFWGGGSLIPVQDSPQDALHLFTPANVVDGVFNYSGTGKNTRHSVALVSWNDPDDFYRLKVEYVEDVEAILLYGVNKTEIVAFGCTSRGQANRLGKWLLLTETIETDTVTFKVGLDGFFIPPGRVIKIQDPARAGERFGGRIKSATVNSIELDSEVEIEAGKDYTLTVVFPDGTNEEQDVTNVPGFYTTLTTDTFSQSPEVQAIWILASDDLVPQQFRVVAVSETGKAEIAVIALKYNPGKFDAVEQGIQLEALPISGVLNVLSAPVNLIIGEYQVNHQGELKTVMIVSWDAVPQAVSFQFKYRRFNENFIALPETSNHFIEVFDADPGTYQVSVIAVSTESIVSLEATAVGQVLGSSAVAVMPDITGLSLFQNETTEFTGDEIKITWDEVRVDGDPEASVFETYELQVFDDQSELLRVEQLTDNSYVYSFEKNDEDDELSTTPALPIRVPIVVSPFPAKLKIRASVAFVLAPVLIPFPVEIAGVVLRLDAADTDTITEASNNVSQWDDKSGSGNHAVLGASPKTNLNTIKGLNVISWDLFNNILTITSPSLDGLWATGATIIFVSQSNSLGAGNVGRFLDKEQMWRVNKKAGGTGALAFTVKFSTTSGTFETPDNSFPLTPSIVTLTYDASSTANLPNIYINGVVQSLGSVTTPIGTYSTNSLPLGIGNRHNGSDRSFDGDFGEIIFYDRIISDPERIELEQYLFNKWTLPPLVVVSPPDAKMRMSAIATSVLIPIIVGPVPAKMKIRTVTGLIDTPFIVEPVAAKMKIRTAVGSADII